MSAVDVQQYLNAEGTAPNDAAIAAAISGGAAPIALAEDLAAASPDLADLFLTCFATAAPGVDIVDLAKAITRKAPDKADAIQAAATALAPDRAPEIAAAVFAARTNTIQEYQISKKQLSPSS